MALIPTPASVLIPSDINDLTAAGIADGLLAYRSGGAWAGLAPNLSEPVNALDTILQTYSTKKVEGINVGIGMQVIDLDIPAGYKFLVFAYTVTNPTTATVNVFPTLRRAGVDYSTVNGVTGAPAAGASIIGTDNIFYPGDQFTLTPSAVGLAFVLKGVLVPDDGNMKLFAVPIASGNNVIYTCPAGKVAELLNATATQADTSTAVSRFSNQSGGPRVYTVHIVPSAGSADASNKIAYIVVASNGNVGVQHGKHSLVAGDSLVFVSDGAGQQFGNAWIWERDA